MYWPHPMYESLVPGATFTIREGAQVGVFISYPSPALRRHLAD